MDITKLLAKLTQSTPDQEKERLDAYLSSRLQKDPNSAVRENEMQLQPKKNVFEANMLRARQEASETPIGKLLGVSPLSEEERQVYSQNTDPEIEEAFRRGSDMGLAMGGLNTMTPKTLKNLKAITQEVEPIAKQVIETPSQLAEMLKKRNLERLENAAYRKNLEFTNKPTKELGQDIVKIQNRYFDLKK